MYRIVTVALATGALMAGPAFAQTTGQSSQSGSQTQSQSGSGTTSGQGSASGSMAMSQDKLKQSLQQAGFQNVKVIDAAYQVHARTSDGNFVTMLVNTDAAGTGAAGQSSGSASTSGGSAGSSGQNSAAAQKLSQSLQKAGFQNVQVVDATYLVEAETPDGDTAIMMIDPPSMAGQRGRTGSGSGGTTQ